MLTSSTPKTFPKTTKPATTIKSVRPAGIAFLNTLIRNRPLIRFLFGSSDRKNAGVPIVNIAKSETCDGSIG